MVKEDFTAVANFCKDGLLGGGCDNQKVMGKWNTYYDQAISIELENNLRFTTNFMY